MTRKDLGFEIQQTEYDNGTTASVLTSYHGREAHLTIPEGISIIARGAFLKCRFLKSVTFPHSLRVIETESFHCCDQLEAVIFQEGLLEIQRRAFWYCSALKEVAFPHSVQLIGSRAFECCSSLKNISFLYPGTFVDEYAFNETPYWNHLLEEAAKCSAKGDPLSCPEKLVLPEGMTHIDLWAYSKSRIVSAWLPNSLRTVGMCAFKDCSLLETVSMSPNTRCNFYANSGPFDGIFAGCANLEHIIFRGPLKDFTWYDASKPQLLRGFDAEKSFMGCNKLKFMTAWEIPLEEFPSQWQRFAINGFLRDLNRREHYLETICSTYDAHLEKMQPQLIKRTARDHSYALHQYLMEQRMITSENYQWVLKQAAESGSVDVIASLLEYQNKVLQIHSFEAALDRGLQELELL